jgi:exodeoxyribonuclease VII small subunit|tara:strand:- start:113 stop:343 length:231 start_codon:yes stop_codon:yes gene_type:complete
MSKKKNEISFEESLERLENLVNKMESGDATLEQSLVWFEEGMDLIKLCQVQLNNAEQKVQELVKKTDGKFELKDIK